MIDYINCDLYFKTINKLIHTDTHAPYTLTHVNKLSTLLLHILDCQPTHSFVMASNVITFTYMYYKVDHSLGRDYYVVTEDFELPVIHCMGNCFFIVPTYIPVLTGIASLDVQGMLYSII